uniref:Uncharacterized protein n=1 Tax=viral metagenome TaxID=1070528 RepID=A0A6C0AF20_9ZZZZ
MLIKFKDIPEWLHESQLYRDFDEEDEEEIEIKYLKDNEEVNNFTDFKYILKVSSFWALDKIPYTVYVYAYYNKEEVENYLKIKTNNIYIDKYKEIEDNFYGNISLKELKLKMINFLKLHNFSEKKIQKIKNFSKKYKEILRYDFDKILKSNSDIFYLNILEDININKKLINNIDDILHFYKKHKNYYNAKKFLKEYKNTPKYSFKTEFFESPDYEDTLEGSSMYRLIIKLFDVEILVIDDHFNVKYKKVNSEISYNNSNITFGTVVHTIIKCKKDEIIIKDIYSSNMRIYIKLNIFNFKNIFEQIKNLKLYKNVEDDF